MSDSRLTPVPIDTTPAGSTRSPQLRSTNTVACFLTTRKTTCRLVGICCRRIPLSFPIILDIGFS